MIPSIQNREQRRRQRRRAVIRALIIQEKQRRGCEICGRRDLPPQSLDFHHIGPKRIGVARTIFGTPSALKEEMSRCILICSCAHHAYHRSGKFVHCDRLRAATPPSVLPSAPAGQSLSP